MISEEAELTNTKATRAETAFAPSGPTQSRGGDPPHFQFAGQLINRGGEHEHRIQGQVNQRHDGRSQHQGAGQVPLGIGDFATDVDGGIPAGVTE